MRRSIMVTEFRIFKINEAFQQHRNNEYFFYLDFKSHSSLRTKKKNRHDVITFEEKTQAGRHFEKKPHRVFAH